MPTSRHSPQRSRRGSWLPDDMFFPPSIERDGAELEDVALTSPDGDPLVYFLTPAPSARAEDDEMDFDMEFDAGIEDAKHPLPMIRSVSPSSLEGLSRSPTRPPTPPRSPSTPDLDYDLSATPDEYDHYHFMEGSRSPRHNSPGTLSRHLRDKFRGHSKQQDLPSPHSLFPPPASPRINAGRSPKPIIPVSSSSSSSARQPRGMSLSRLSPHAWHEPSPDVWAIEEEPEAEVLSEMEDSYYMEDGVGSRAVDIPAAKPKKKVRFALPPAHEFRGTE